MLLAAVLYVRNFFGPLEDVAMFLNSYQSAVAALEKVSGVLEESPTVEDPQHPVALGEPRGELRFDGVSFGYSGSGKGRTVLAAVSYTHLDVYKRQALRRVLEHTTALIVAHRPATVAMADRVAVMQCGVVTELGTHSELLRTSEHYRYLVSSLEAERPERSTRTGEEVSR